MDHIKMLIVDDVEDNRLVLQAISRKVKGFEIREAADGIEAVEAVESWRPDIVLMDIMMPRMDGFEASRIIKERFPETIIMVVTAIIDPQYGTEHEPHRGLRLHPQTDRKRGDPLQTRKLCIIDSGA